jgi:hypothetical protein
MANITGGGKKRKYPLEIMDQILKDVDPEREVRVLYNIGCKLKKIISLVCLISLWCHSCSFSQRYIC